jgi:hypothetical protein
MVERVPNFFTASCVREGLRDVRVCQWDTITRLETLCSAKRSWCVAYNSPLVPSLDQMRACDAQDGLLRTQTSTNDVMFVNSLAFTPSRQRRPSSSCSNRVDHTLNRHRSAYHESHLRSVFSKCIVHLSHVFM